MIMTHPGLPVYWQVLIGVFMLLVSAWAIFAKAPEKTSHVGWPLERMPLVGLLIRFLNASPWPLLFAKIIMVAIFITVIYSGLQGTPIPERNLATVLTWNLWWAGLVVAIFFLGSAWCAICPWDALATWLVRMRLWGRGKLNNSLNIKVPKWLRNVWPALLMFMVLTWFELGVGVTLDPYATAVLSLLMVVMATVSLALFEDKAFCHYFCPVGRTVGYYSQLAPVALRPLDPNICAACTTLECYHGSETVEPCPTHLVMGTLKENTFCTSCGNCVQSCPDQNVSWHLRPQSVEVKQDARPNWDDAWFMLGLLTLTSFHGITMLPFWYDGISQFGSRIGDSGQLLLSFSLGMLFIMFAPIALYAVLVYVAQQWTGKAVRYREAFSVLAFASLPLAFSYHIAHNLNHLVRESHDLWSLFTNPTGEGTLPLSMMEKHERHLQMIISQDTLFLMQGGLMLFGFWLAVQVIRYRAFALYSETKLWVLPILLFAILVHGFDLWLMAQPMTMRM